MLTEVSVDTMPHTSSRIPRKNHKYWRGDFLSGVVSTGLTLCCIVGIVYFVDVPPIGSDEFLLFLTIPTMIGALVLLCIWVVYVNFRLWWTTLTMEGVRQRQGLLLHRCVHIEWRDIGRLRLVGRWVPDPRNVRVKVFAGDSAISIPLDLFDKPSVFVQFLKQRLEGTDVENSEELQWLEKESQAWRLEEIERETKNKKP